MSCCSGNITQIVRTAAGSNCCPTLDLANETATLVDADGNVLTLMQGLTIDEVTVGVAGGEITVSVNGVQGTAQIEGVPDVITSLVRTNGSLSFQDEAGNTTNIDLSDLVNTPETITSLAYDAGTNMLTFAQEGGTQQVIDLSPLSAETTTSLVFNAVTSTLTFTDETGTANILDLSTFQETETTIVFDQATGVLTYTPESGVAIPIDLSPLENLTTLAFDPATQRLTYTDEAGVATVSDLNVLNVLTTIQYDPNTSFITYTDEAGTPNQIDLTGLRETVTTLVFNPNDSVLTYTNEAGAGLAIDLSPLIPVTTANSPEITLSGDGTAATPLTATANISAQADNALQAVADGLFVLQQGVSAISFNVATGILQFTDQTGASTNLDLSGLMAASTTANSPTVTLTGDGTAATPLQADAVISGQAGNTLQAIADGLFVPAAMVNAALELVGTNLNLRVDGNVVSTIDLRNAATVIINDALGNPIGRALPL